MLNDGLESTDGATEHAPAAGAGIATEKASEFGSKAWAPEPLRE